MKRGDLLPDDVVRPHAIPMVGRRFGNLRVLAHAGRRDYGVMPSTGRHTRVLLFRVRCGCGSESVIEGRALRQGTSQCLACAQEKARRLGKDKRSLRLPDGRTLAQIADAAGLSLNTVYRRHLRGWPPEYLGMELRKGGGGRGYGGHVDLPERRCTVYPERRAP